MNPSAIIAARETAIALAQQSDDATESLLKRLNYDANLADATRRLISAVVTAVQRSLRVSESKEIPTTMIDAIQPLAQSYGYTLSLSPTGSSVIITAN